MKYKVFSFSTTIRNPKRNVEFLHALRRFNGFVFDAKIAKLCFEEFVKNGIYTLSNISNEIKDKLENEIELNDSEFKKLLALNPHIATLKKIVFRIKTHLQALESQGFIMLLGDKKCKAISLTKFAFDLLERKSSPTNIYAKIMIGWHTNNPTRPEIANKARPFLNTIFVIDSLKKEWGKLGNESKGILKHEFKSFVLGMKDCDYAKCVSEILAYRKIYGLEENKEYITQYLFEKQGLERVSYATLNDYADEVFRKFEMSGLLIARGVAQYIYYDFSHFEGAKIQALLQTYKGYDCLDFTSVQEYIAFLESVNLPWIQNEAVRKSVVAQKAKSLNVSVNTSEFENLDALESRLNQAFYTKSLQSKIEKSEIANLLNELRILASAKESQSNDFKNIPESLRLEYLLALILGKKYGLNNLQSNLIYNENGEPLSYAPAGKADLVYENCNFEATMIKNRNQQLNSETTSIARHLYESQKQSSVEQRAVLIAPYIHFDVALFFKFCAKEFESKLAPITLKNFIELVESSATFGEFKRNFDALFVERLLREKTDSYIDSVNARA
ncbi:AlwI family type II restriction endonuclease [Helicobacter sp. 23-1048]